MVSPGIRICQLCASVFLLFIAMDAQAATVPLTPDDLPTISVADESGNTLWSYTPTLGQLKRATGRGWAFSAAPEHASEFGQFAIDQLEFDPDPFIIANIVVTNTTASTQTFTFTVSLPTVFSAPNEISGTVTTTAIDGGGAAGATVASVPGSPIYTALIDSVAVATLQDDPFSLTAGSATESFGPTASAVPVTSTIGLQLRFSVSPQDSASIFGRFDVNAPAAVPLPTAAWGGLSLLSMLSLMRYRRR